MNLIDFTRIGGYRLKQYTLNKMQSAYFHILNMFIGFCNIPTIGSFVVSGCKVVGANITDGYLYIDGELCYFDGKPGDLNTKISKEVLNESMSFKNGNIEPNIFRSTSAVLDPINGVELGNFTRMFPVFDGNYVHTDNNFTNNLKILAENAVQFVARGDAGGYYSLVANVEYSDTIFVTLAAPVPFGNIDLIITTSGAYPVQYIVGGLASGSNTFYITFKVKSPVSGSQLVAFNYLIVKSN